MSDEQRSSESSKTLWQNSVKAYRQRLLDLDRRLAPPPDLTVSDWADRYRKLSSEASAEPGQWQTDRAPFQREIMDAVTDPSVDEVVMMKSAQVGGTEILLNVMGYFAHQDPSPMLCVQPTLEMGQSFSKDRLAPMARDTLPLKELFAPSLSKSGDNTLLHKRFPGGHLTIAGANSAAGLASRPIRIAIFDEVDKYPGSAGPGGDPVALGKKRTRTFWNRKILMASTPTVRGESRIDREFERSDQRRYHVPCPHCGHKAPFEFKDFEFEDLENPFWMCRECGGTATEQDKAAMVRGGKWVATAEFTGIAGFHINEFYSPWSTWPEIFAEYEAAKGHPEEMREWVNETLGEVWEHSDETIEPDSLAERAELYPADVPAGALILTSGTDVQGDRFETSVWGWGEDGQSWLIEHHVMTADPKNKADWKRLDDWLMSRKYEHQTGSMVGITAGCIDSSYRTDEVYRYCAKRFVRRIWAVKGVEGEGKPAATRAAKPRAAGPTPQSVFVLGVDGIKAHLYGCLQAESGANTVHFPVGIFKDCEREEIAALEAEYYAQLTAERRLPKMVRGFRRYVWKKTRNRNEALDCWVYAYAALQILNPVWERITAPKKKKPKEPEPLNTLKPRRPVRPRRNYAQRWR